MQPHIGGETRPNYQLAIIQEISMGLKGDIF
jgi:hypothetical protein